MYLRSFPLYINNMKGSPLCTPILHCRYGKNTVPLHFTTFPSKSKSKSSPCQSGTFKTKLQKCSLSLCLSKLKRQLLFNLEKGHTHEPKNNSTHHYQYHHLPPLTCYHHHNHFPLEFSQNKTRIFVNL